MASFHSPAPGEQAVLLQVLAAGAGAEAARRHAAALLDRFGSVAAALAAPVGEIERVLGNDARACAEQVKALQQLVLCVLRSGIADRPILKATGPLRDYLRVSLAHETREQTRVLYLDVGHHLIADELAGEGTINHAPLYPREVVRRALELGAKSLLLVHNHPSGGAEPSFADIEMTDRVDAACRTLELELIDHLLVARQTVVSFRARGLIGTTKRGRAARPREPERRAAVA